MAGWQQTGGSAFALMLAAVLTGGTAVVSGEGLRLQGQWAGKVQLDSRFPEIPWRVKLDTMVVGEGGTRVELVADLRGGEVTVLVNSGDNPGGYTWALASQTLAVAALQPLGATLWPELRGLSLDGELMVSGDGTWADGLAEGELEFQWRSERLGWSEYDLELRGLEITGAVKLRNSAVEDVAVNLNWRSATVGGFALGPGRVEIDCQGGAVWAVKRGEASVWGGGVALAPFRYDPAEGKVQTAIVLSEVLADELAKLVPRALASASGRLSGEMRVSWSKESGLRPGGGSLAMVATESSQVRMAAAPGLLSSRVPSRIETLPQWLGPIAKWAKIENPAHDDLVEIEMGRRALVVERLEVKFSPDGRGAMRTVRADLVARPVGSPAVKRVSFGINVMGAWEDLGMLTRSKGASITVKP